MKDYFENFENRARKSLTADGLEERYIDRRVKNFDEIKKENIIWSGDIHGGLVDTYGQFDLTELTYEEENEAGRELEEETGVEITEWNRNFNFVWLLEVMAEQSLNYFVSHIDGLEARVISVFAPSEYNYRTDDYEIEVLKNPFDTIEALVEEMKRVCIENYDEYKDERLSHRLCDDYVYDMIECIDNTIIENTDSLTINGEDYDTEEDFKKKYRATILNNEIEKHKKFICDETGLKPAYFEDILAWSLNNCDLAEEAPQIFGSDTPANRAWIEIWKNFQKMSEK